MKKILLVSALLCISFFIVILSTNDRVVCAGPFRIGYSYHYQWKPFRVVKEGRKSFACQVGDRVYIMDSKGNTYILPERVNSVWSLSSFRDSSVGYFYSCQGYTTFYRYIYNTHESIPVDYWYEPSYVSSERCV